MPFALLGRCEKGNRPPKSDIPCAHLQELCSPLRGLKSADVECEEDGRPSSSSRNCDEHLSAASEKVQTQKLQGYHAFTKKNMRSQNGLYFRLRSRLRTGKFAAWLVVASLLLARFHCMPSQFLFALGSRFLACRKICGTLFKVLIESIESVVGRPQTA